MIEIHIWQILAASLVFFIVGLYIGVVSSNKPKGEQVNHPAHYQKNGKECIEVMEEKYGPMAVYNFCICNSFKYEWRAGEKDGNSTEQDLAKAKWYREYAIKLFNKYPDIFNIPNGS
jgi:hypothetical protein